MASMRDPNEYKALHMQISSLALDSNDNASHLPETELENDEETATQGRALDAMDTQTDPLHQPNVTDYEVIQRNLDRAHENMKALMFSYTQITQQRLRETHQIERKKLLATHNNEVILLEHRVEELQKRVNGMMQSTSNTQSKYNRLIKKLCSQLMHMRGMWRGSHSSRSCFRAWRQHIQRRRRHTFILRARSYRNRSQTLRQTLTIWRFEGQREKYSREIAAERKRQMEDRMALMSNHEAQIAGLQNELRDVRHSADLSGGKQRQMEENLRKIFLRGVSAMNIEALSLFQHQHNSKTNEDFLPQTEKIIEDSEDSLEGNKALESHLFRPELPVKKPVEHADMQQRLQELIATSQEQIKQIQRHHKQNAMEVQTTNGNGLPKHLCRNGDRKYQNPSSH